MQGEKLKITIVVAAAENGVIGRGGQLPWRMPSDLKTFRRLTMGKPVIMGRKTFRSLGKPLEGRDNIVVTRDADFAAPGAMVASSLDAALALARRAAEARGVDEIAVIGGADIYEQTIARADRIYLSRIHAAIEGDATFAPLDPSKWQEVERTPIATGDRDEHRATLVVYDRIEGSSPTA
ncbi:MAG: dihydrofolate reductase [Hyphomicrobiaceae bacterium]|jgi:dihydrofolate reductase